MSDRRMEICKALGLGDILSTHNIIVAGIAKGPEWLLHKGLNARVLTDLGYDAAGMARLGFSAAALEGLGFHAAHHTPAPAEPPPPVPASRSAAGDDADDAEGEMTTAEQIRWFVDSGLRAHELRAHGFTVDLVKRAGYSAMELVRVGFELEELASLCSAAELRRADFKPQELRRFFSGDDLRRAGFSATDMRQAGYSVRDLLRLGFNENHVRTAGFPTAELMREGLGKTTRELQ